MRWIPLSVALLASLAGAVVPHEAGSGGDAVFCRESEESPFRGFYSLDYILTWNNEGKGLVPVNTWEQSSGRLARQLEEKYPDLGRLFADFVRDMGNHSSYLRPRIWEAATYGLVGIDDERIIRKLPPNCYERAGTKINIIQSVIRVRKPSLIIYEYDPKIYAELKKNAPLQFSFLMVHEWLWDFTDDIAVVRRVNHLLHSGALEALGARELRTALENIGFSLRYPGPRSVCERTPQLRSTLEAKLGQPCHAMGPTLPLTFLDLSDKDIDSLRIGDFAGLLRLTWMSLKRNRLETLLADTFGGLQALITLDLSENRLTAIPAEVFEPVPMLYELRLNRNRLKVIPPALFAPLKYLRLIDLSSNELDSLPDGLIRAPVSGDKLWIRLSNNRLRALPAGLPDEKHIVAIVIGGNPLTAAARRELEIRYGDKVVWQ